MTTSSSVVVVASSSVAVVGTAAVVVVGAAFVVACPYSILQDCSTQLNYSVGNFLAVGSGTLVAAAFVVALQLVVVVVEAAFAGCYTYRFRRLPHDCTCLDFVGFADSHLLLYRPSYWTVVEVAVAVVDIAEDFVASCFAVGKVAVALTAVAVALVAVVVDCTAAVGSYHYYTEVVASSFCY